MASLLLVLLAVVLVGLKRAVELVLEKEYASWAPGLARLLVRAAGFVYWPRRDQWEADLRYLQKVEGMSGLLPAGWCLLSAPGLFLRHFAATVGVTCMRQWEERASVAGGVLVIGVTGTLILGPQFAGANLPVYSPSVNLSPDGKMLATGGGEDATVRLWDVATGKPFGQPLSGAGWYLQFSPDGNILASESDNGAVRLWDVATGKPDGQPLTAAGPFTGTGVYLQFSPDGKVLATESDNGAVRLWDVATGKPFGQPLTAAGPFASSGRFFEFSPDGKLLGTVSADGAVHLWDVATGKPDGPPLTGSGRFFEFSPDGKLLGTAGTDGVVRLWDVATEKPHGQPITGAGVYLQFSPDGKVLATESDGVVRFWDVATGKPNGHPVIGASAAVQFSPDGKLLAFPGAEGTVELWDVAREQLRLWVLEDDTSRPGAMGIIAAGFVLSVLVSVVVSLLVALIRGLKTRLRLRRRPVSA